MLTHMCSSLAYQSITKHLLFSYESLTKPASFPPSYLKYCASPHVYKAPGTQRSPGGIPPSIGQNYPSLSLSISVSLYFFESCRLQCKSKGFSIQVYSSLSSPSLFPRLRWSLGSLFSVSHRFWTSGAPLSICCTHLQV